MRNITTATAVALTLCASAVHAQSIPSGREVLVRSLKVSGADTVMPKHKTLKLSGTYVTPNGPSGVITLTRTSAGEFRRVMDLEGYGVIAQGYADGTAYSSNALTETVLLTGPQLAMTRAQAVWLDSPDNYVSIANLGAEKFAGKDAYKLELLSKDSVKSTRYFDVATGLQLGSSHVLETDQGPIAIQQILEDYRDIGGLLIPAKLQQVGGSDQLVTFDRIEWDVATPADYALPADVAAMKKGT